MGKSIEKAQKISGKSNIKRKISKQEDKFKLSDIIKYLHGKIPAKNYYDLPLKLIPIYSRLSSFVHCGVIADIDDLFASEKVPEEFAEVPDILMLTLSNDFLLAFAIFDNFSRHLKGETNNTFAQQSQKLSNIYYEIQTKLTDS
jgi:hypothetical protein